MKYIQTWWLSMLGILALGIVLAGCGAAASSSSEPARATVSGSAQQEGGAAVSVMAKDFSFALDPGQAKAGAVTFAVENSGSAQHDFKITGNGVEQKTPLLESSKSASLTVDLRPGTYSYVCTVPGHEALGMKGTFTVSQ